MSAFAGRPAEIQISWPPLAGVARYHARWTDAGGPVEADLAGSATAFRRAGATAGHHVLSIVAIDDRGRASEPTEIAVDVVEITAIPPGGDPAYPAPGPAFAIGTRFASPGLSCRLGGEPAVPEAVAGSIGATTLTCGGEPGQPRVDVRIVVAPVVIAGPGRPLVRGARTRVHLTVASVAPVGDHLQVDAIGELTLGDAKRTRTGIDLSVTPLAGATKAGLQIRGGGLDLGRVELAVVAPPIDPPPVIDWFALDLGGQVGALVLPSQGAGATSLGAPRDPGDSLSSGLLAGGRVGLFPIRAVGLEGELALALPGFRGHAGVAIVTSARAQLAVRVVDSGRYGLRLVGGGGSLGVLSSGESSRHTTQGGVHWGAAFTAELQPDVWVRLEALHVMTSARDAGFAHCAELSIGFMTRLGRRDHSR